VKWHSAFFAPFPSFSAIYWLFCNFRSTGKAMYQFKKVDRYFRWGIRSFLAGGKKKLEKSSAVLLMLGITQALNSAATKQMGFPTQRHCRARKTRTSKDQLAPSITQTPQARPTHWVSDFIVGNLSHLNALASTPQIGVIPHPVGEQDRVIN
jgi:hypothetical protein